MKTNVACAYPEQTVVEAAERMRDENVGFLPVCDHTKQVLGTLTDRDLAIRVLAEAKQPEMLVTDVMTREVVSCRPDDDLQTAEAQMAEHHKSRIVCIDDDGRLAGVISLSDIAQCGDGLEAARTLREITTRETRQLFQ